MLAIKSLGIEDTKRQLSIARFDCELQMGDDILQMGPDFYTKAFSELEKLNVCSIHTPLIAGESVEIAGLVGSEKSFNYTCQVAQALAEKQEHDIGVVIHTNVDSYDLETYKYNNSIQIISSALNKFPNIYLLIENTMNFCVLDYNKYVFRRGTDSNYHDVARYIKRILSSTRVFSLLDICHAMASINILDTLNKGCPFIQVCTLEDYFKNGTDICKAIHLAYATGFGANCLKQHGLGFHADKPEEVALLKQIMQYQKSYIPDANIIIEVTESDYHLKPNEDATYKLWKQLEEEMNKNKISGLNSVNWSE